MTIERLWYWFHNSFISSRTYSLATVTVRSRDSQRIQTYEIDNFYICKAKHRR
jgi:hypothetical protein